MSPISRRHFLALGAAGLAAACTRESGIDDTLGGTTPSAARSATASVPDLAGPPFTLGVAAGDPLADRVVLWTRLAPVPDEPAGGMPDEDVSVTWEVASSDQFTNTVATGLAIAQPDYAHSIHVDVGGLTPDTTYFYRFRLGDWTSAVGRARTMPASGAAPGAGSLRVGFASCQNYEAGLYVAHRHLAEEQLDLLVWLGDFIYEGAASSDKVRAHRGGEVATLDRYRDRYAQYLGDLNLQLSRASTAWAVIWDDHEVDNDYAGAVAQDGTPVGSFLERRAAAYRAWWEHQPVRIDPPVGPDLQIYRTLPLGSLATVVLTDLRQYRSEQACGGGVTAPCGEEVDPTRTILGAAQRNWLLDQLGTSTTTWNVLASELVMTSLPFGPLLNMDQWDGYQADRRAVTDALAARPELNPIVISGDIHAFGVAEVAADPADPASPVVAPEFVGGAISSRFDEGLADTAAALVSGLPNVRFVDTRHNGYGVLELTPEEARCRLRTVSDVTDLDATIRTEAEFRVRPGEPVPVRLS